MSAEPWTLRQDNKTHGKAVISLTNDEAKVCMAILDGMRAGMAPILFSKAELLALGKQLSTLFISYEYADARAAAHRICQAAEVMMQH